MFFTKKNPSDTNEMIEVPHLPKNRTLCSMMVSRKTAGSVGDIRIFDYTNERFITTLSGFVVQFSDNKGLYMFSTKGFASLEEAEAGRDEILRVLTDFANGKPRVIVLVGWKDWIPEQPSKGLVNPDYRG